MVLSSSLGLFRVISDLLICFVKLWGLMLVGWVVWIAGFLGLLEFVGFTLGDSWLAIFLVLCLI